MKATEVVPALAALAQENRLDVFRLLVQAGPDGMAAGHIADRLGLVSATLSFHLAQLKHAGLVTVRRDGRSLIYAADYARMNGLIGFLTENCCRGHAAMQAAACAPVPARKARRRETSART
ncbi:helix-turn-helix transcriptional regulator [Vineibacter terrae]|uniref:Helix-turn-helix transcriptional regulator n=1 Tax=Vineibacter terrae TaxID=2586908 RepID=A0A5C8PIS0_9HYPH|nr:metalloregulator ArsR/SmtB family transcription factor [Vineibacter terrae]TXL73417.1 helix-turn-helix transcriptional regulator [Vineibacter terrae]